MTAKRHAPRRTVLDWMVRAQAAEAGGDAGELARCFSEAAAVARSFHDGLSLLRGLAGAWEGQAIGTPERESDAERARALAVRAELVLAGAEAEGEVWGFREVAAARGARLGDEAGARAALEAGERTFAARETPGYVWVLLAKGWMETLGDRVAARRCLTVARASGSADDLCDAASGLAVLGDVDEARALLAEAEALPVAAPAQAWTIANAYRALGDLAAANRVLEAALAAAADVGAALWIAKAYASHQDAAGVAHAIARAETLATRAEEWVEVAEVGHETGHDPAAVRRALDEAVARARPDDTAMREKIVTGYSRWLGDGEAAARVGPGGVKPGAMPAPRAARLSAWDPSPDALFTLLRARVTDAQLEAIASSDYVTAVPEHFAALKEIVARGEVPTRMPWHPGEVVELYRWSSGERVDHVSRAFCCTLLCLCGRQDGLDNVAAQLVESCLALGDDALGAAMRLLAWCGATSPHDAPEDDDPLDPDPAALLGLALACLAADPDDPRLAEVVDLLGTRDLREVVDGSVVPQLWTALIEDLVVPARAGRPAVEALLARLG